MVNGVVIDGKTHPLIHPGTGEPIRVFGPEDTGMEFKAGVGNSRKRTVPVTLGVVHWTASEVSAAAIFNVLKTRELGVEYVINAFGDLYQFCDQAHVDTADAGAANKISWGVEIVSAGVYSSKWAEPNGRTPKLGPRDAYNASIHGQTVRCLDFYKDQFATLCALNKLIADVVPTYGRAVCTASTVIDWKTFNGAVGHFHITTGKLDPGPRPMQKLAYFMETGRLSKPEANA